MGTEAAGGEPGSSDGDPGDGFRRALEKVVADRTAFFLDAFTALGVCGISGDYVEFGSWGGQSLSLAYKTIRDFGQQRHLWAFDSFRGLPPSDHPADHRWLKGGEGQGGVERFHEDCARLGVPREAYTVVEGYYSESLPAIGDGEPRDIALAYVDCNMYRSTVEVLEFLAPRLKPGMIVAFDDYFCYSPTEVSGERLALHEFLDSHPEWSFCRFKDVSWGGVSFVVEPGGKRYLP